MALVHAVQFSSIKEMVVGVVDVLTQFPPRDPIPVWWEKFVVWAEEKNFEDVPSMEKALEELDKAKDKPDWWQLAEKAFKAAKSIKSIELRTDPFEDDDEDEDILAARDEGDDEGDGDGDEGDEGDDEGNEGDDDADEKSDDEK